MPETPPGKERKRISKRKQGYVKLITLYEARCQCCDKTDKDCDSNLLMKARDKFRRKGWSKSSAQGGWLCPACAIKFDPFS